MTEQQLLLSERAELTADDITQIGTEDTQEIEPVFAQLADENPRVFAEFSGAEARNSIGRPLDPLHKRIGGAIVEMTKAFFGASSL